MRTLRVGLLYRRLFEFSRRWARTGFYFYYLLPFYLSETAADLWKQWIVEIETPGNLSLLLKPEIEKRNEKTPAEKQDFAEQ
jgi:hypothetical protein